MQALDFEHSSSLTKFIIYFLKNVFDCSLHWATPLVKQLRCTKSIVLDRGGSPLI